MSDAEARAVELSRGQRRGPLHGVPVAIKELFDVSGVPCDYGSDALAWPRRRRRRRTGLSPATRRCRCRRHHPIARVRVGYHDAAPNSSRHPQPVEPRPHPRRIERRFGSSGRHGHGAGGRGQRHRRLDPHSRRRFCGVAGLKPTLGLIGRSGGVALAPSFDTPGALGRSIEDVAIVVATMSGDDPDDPAALADEYRVRRTGSGFAGRPADRDLGCPRRHRARCRSRERRRSSVGDLHGPRRGTRRGAICPQAADDARHVRADADGRGVSRPLHRVLELFPERADDYGVDVRRRLEAAASVTVGDYLSAQERRRHIVAAFDRALRWVDAIVSPISAVGPSRIDSSDRSVVNGERRPLRDVVMRFTVPHNLTGLPAAIVYAGRDHDRLPVGLQLDGRSLARGQGRRHRRGVTGRRRSDRDRARLLRPDGR